MSNINSPEKIAEQKRIKKEMVQLYNDFPFKYSFWEQVADIPKSSFVRKISDDKKNKYYHFSQEELDRAKEYIRRTVKKYLE